MTGNPDVVKDDGFREFLGPRYEHESLHIGDVDTRFLVLHPSSGDPEDPRNVPVARADGFMAVKNARGHRLFEAQIEVDGKYMSVSVALEKFLRHYRRHDASVRLWARYLCVNEADEQERLLYWTREFVDKMYEKAQSVVDMQSFLCSLQDRGNFQRLIEPRYMEWRKNWNTIPKDWALPEVYPIKLGKKACIENPTEDYEYLPLDTVADETRIVVMPQNEDPDASLVFHLAHCPVYSEVTYCALSYTWGDDTRTGEVTANGLKMRIRKNLEMALRSLLAADCPLAIWADAICINQHDIVERNREISRMSSIFDRAVSVVCCVGDANGHSDLALDFVKRLQQPVITEDGTGNFVVGKPERISPNDVPKFCAALYLFLTRPYFRRVWILQEVALASNPLIGCGKRWNLSFEKLDCAAYNLQDMLSRDQKLHARMKEAIPELQEISLDELLFVRNILYFRHLHIGRGGTTGFIKADIKPTAPGYLETPILARNCEATDPRDKMFAPWNIAKDKDGLNFKMDYSIPYEEVFTDFARAWALNSGTLDILGGSEFVSPSNDKAFYTKAPAWCPDWSTPSQSSCLVRREGFRRLMMEWHDQIDGQIYSADGKMCQKSGSDQFFEFDGHALRCLGIVLDRVVAFHLSDSEDKSVESRVDGQLPAIEKYLTTAELATYVDVAQAVVAMLHGDVVASWPKRNENLQNASEHYPDEGYVCIPYRPGLSEEHPPNASRHVPYFGAHYSRQEAWEAVCRSMRGRRVFISEKGHIGLMPDYISPESHCGHPLMLAILATCSVPVLLHEHPDVEGAYRLLGTCFVQGWMEGEVLKEAMGCDEPAEFWKALEGTEKLRII